MTQDTIWQAKLHARLHDPAEKALVLLRDPAGHEGGTSRALHRLLGLETAVDHSASGAETGDADSLHRHLCATVLSPQTYRLVRRADWWASAADRPQWPMDEITVATRAGEQRTLKIQGWAQVNWTKRPVLRHPLTGEQIDLASKGGLADTDLADIKQRSLAHFSSLIQRAAGSSVIDEPDEANARRALLALWRFGPEIDDEHDHGRLGELWRLLPADTRVPDHSIWDHLDLTSAFTGAFQADPDGEAALLAMSIGPVQPFIEAARTTSDLWAGSHLLARLAWEVMRPVAEALGPDAILFPRLRGVPQVDLWLREQGLPAELFKDCEWLRGATDSNPLFSAALPNRFVAVVPRSKATKLAKEAEQAVRAWLDETGRRVVDELLRAAGMADAEAQHCHEQMREQLAGFPEVHWAAVPFSLIGVGNPTRQTDLDTTHLSEAMAPFFGVEAGQPCGFLDTPAWRLLQQPTHWQRSSNEKGEQGDQGPAFFQPNPGVLYPAVYDLLERVLAASKSARAFHALDQKGWRCALTGESEWLTTDPSQLERSYRQRTDTLWAKIGERRPAWARKGEHLGGLAAIKRVWPSLFAKEVGNATGQSMQRFVVSTHTMALAGQLENWMAQGAPQPKGWDDALANHSYEPVPLPRKLAKLAHKQRNGGEIITRAQQLMGLIEASREVDEDPEQSRDLEALFSQTLSARGAGRETYYGLLLLDGDQMGRWLAGDEPGFGITYQESFHPHVSRGFAERARDHKGLSAYGQQQRALSPNRHLAISGALNDFSLHVVRHVVEEEHAGRLLYAGGDDVMAMLPVTDLLPAMARLRRAYSGDGDGATEGQPGSPRALRLDNGFAWLNGRLMRMMGQRATASAGAVVAHHQAPLGAVLRALRAAEQRAKKQGDRNAFHLTVVKRSGGDLHLTAGWGEPLALLIAMRDFLADPEVSRRAAYHCQLWLKDLPAEAGQGELLATLLAHQFSQQSGGAGTAQRHDTAGLAQRLAKLAMDAGAQLGEPATDWVENFLGVAEFLARRDLSQPASADRGEDAA